MPLKVLFCTFLIHPCVELRSSNCKCHEHEHVIGFCIVGIAIIVNYEREQHFFKGCAYLCYLSPWRCLANDLRWSSKAALSKLHNIYVICKNFRRVYSVCLLYQLTDVDEESAYCIYWLMLMRELEGWQVDISSVGALFGLDRVLAIDCSLDTCCGQASVTIYARSKFQTKHLTLSFYLFIWEHCFNHNSNDQICLVLIVLNSRL